MKMFMVYLCEGTKTLFRMSYAVMKRLHETIMGVQDRDKVLEVLKREGPSVISDSHYIMRWGFRMALTRYNNSYVGQKPHIPSSGLKLEGKVYIYILLGARTRLDPDGLQAQDGCALAAHKRRRCILVALSRG